MEFRVCRFVHIMFYSSSCSICWGF